MHSLCDMEKGGFLNCLSHINIDPHDYKNAGRIFWRDQIYLSDKISFMKTVEYKKLLLKTAFNMKNRYKINYRLAMIQLKHIILFYQTIVTFLMLTWNYTYSQDSQILTTSILLSDEVSSGSLLLDWLIRKVCSA